MKIIYIFWTLLLFCFNRVATTWCHNPYIPRRIEFEKGISSNGSLQLTEAEAQEGEIIKHHAVYLSMSSSTDVLYGAMATLDVYESPNVKDGKISSAEIWVSNFENGQVENGIQVGWNIQPSYYGDHKTHFLIGWTADGYKSTGCLDLKCAGFVPIKSAPITPGDTLKGRSKISIKIFKSKHDGHWWLHFAHAGQKFAPVGYWPRSLFNRMSDHANHLSWGGFTGSRAGEPSPPMGNGNRSGPDSAAFEDVQYVNTVGQGYPGGVYAMISHDACYQVSAITHGKFYYGGPGGCTN